MKIAYVVSLFPCWSETFILREIQEMVRRGVEVHVFSLRHPAETLVQPAALPLLKKVHYPSLFRSLTAVLRYLILHPLILDGLVVKMMGAMWHNPEMLLKSLAMIPRTLGFLRAIEEEKIDYVHAHWATYPATAAWVFKHLSGTPYSFTAHAHDIWLAKPLLGEKIRGASFVAAISEYNRLYLAPFAGEGREKVKVIHCGLDLERFPYRKPAGAPAVRLVAVGRHDAIKGFTHLIEACRILKESGFAFHCRIIGDGPLRPQLEEQIARDGLRDFVALLPAMPQEKLRPEILDSSLFIAPSVRMPNGNQDGIPVVLMEAMALGIPVISTRVSGIPELIRHDQNGILVEPGDDRALAGAVRELAPDAGKLARLSLAARATIEAEFDIKGTVDRLVHEISSPRGAFGALPLSLELPV